MTISYRGDGNLDKFQATLCICVATQLGQTRDLYLSKTVLSSQVVSNSFIYKYKAVKN